MCLFWEDKWCSEVALAHVFPKLYSVTENKHSTVFQCGVSINNGWHWRIKFRRSLLGVQVDDYEKLLSILYDTRPPNQKDLRIWRWEGKGLFTAKSYYSLLINRDMVYPFYHLWSLNAPLKVKILMWLVLKGGLNTDDTLAHKGIGQGGLWVFCTTSTESIQQIFLECPYVQYIWFRLTAGLEIANLPANLFTMLIEWREKYVRRLLELNGIYLYWQSVGVFGMKEILEVSPKKLTVVILFLNLLIPVLLFGEKICQGNNGKSLLEDARMELLDKWLFKRELIVWSQVLRSFEIRVKVKWWMLLLMG